MRRSVILYQQHAGRMFRAHWKVQGQCVLRDTGALMALKKKGIQYEDANDVAAYKPAERKEITVAPFWKTIPEDKTEPYLFYGDNNVLIGGFEQAQIFCNAIQFPQESLSVFNTDSELLPVQDKLVKRCVRSSLLFDAYQEKLPIKKDPERPAWNFPRYYGITSKRGNNLIGNRLVQLCSSLSPQLLVHRNILKNSRFINPFKREGENVILDHKADILILSSSPLQSPSIDKNILNDSIEKGLPDIHPMSQLVSLEQCEKLSSSEIFYPLNDSKWNVHTAFIYFDPTEVCNLYDVNVTDDQIKARCLMKAYNFAVGQARSKYGNELKDPITIQCIQTDSKNYYFSVFQLNTISCHSQTQKRNYFWISDKMEIYNTCEVVKGVSILDGYNSSVFKTLLAFYYNS